MFMEMYIGSYVYIFFLLLLFFQKEMLSLQLRLRVV